MERNYVIVTLCIWWQYRSVCGCAAPFQSGTCNSASATPTSVNLYWSPTASASYYKISYSRLTDGVEVALTTTSTSLTVDSLTPGYLYTFYLQSYGAGGASRKTNCSYSTRKLTTKRPNYIGQTSFSVIAIIWHTDTHTSDRLLYMTSKIIAKRKTGEGIIRPGEHILICVTYFAARPSRVSTGIHIITPIMWTIVAGIYAHWRNFRAELFAT